MASENGLQLTAKSPDFTDTKLQECLTSIYDSSRAATEINALESKLGSLIHIRKTLINGDNISPTNLEQMNNTIDDLQKNINNKRQEMSESEKQVIKGFMEVITHVSKTTSSRGEEVTAKFTGVLKSFSDSLRKEFTAHMTKNETAITELQNTKMNRSEKEAITQHINEFKASMTEVQKNSIQKMAVDSAGLFRTITDKIGLLCKQFDPAKVAATVEEQVMKRMDEKLKQELQELHDETQKAINTTNEKVGAIPATITNAVKKLINDNISPANMQKLILALPEFQALKNVGVHVSASTEIDPQNLPNFEAIKESIARLTAELVELKQSSNQTRTIVDTIRTQSVGSTNTNLEEFDHIVAVKRMEEMEREVSVIHNNIKMIETLVNVKSKTEDDQQVTSGNKRARTEAISISPESDNSEILSLLNEVENKHQKLLDFILQCKDTVLDDSFPSRLEAAMVKIEQVLMNHERFISFLIDPFTTAKSEKPSISTANVPEGTLSPAMIDAISQLVQKKAQEVSGPLEKKIKLLEDKLKSRP